LRTAEMFIYAWQTMINVL